MSRARGMKIAGIVCIALLAAGCAGASQGSRVEEAFAQNALEEESWSTYQWEQQAQFSWDTAVGHDEPGSMRIDAGAPEDARLIWSMEVEPNTSYHFSCWVRTEGVGREGLGANISAIGLTSVSESVTGTSEWRCLEWYGKTGPDQESLDLTLGLGGYGQLNSGTVWFDDLVVEELKHIPAGAEAASLYTEDSAESEEDFPNSLGMGLTLAVIALIGLCFVLIAHLRDRREDVSEEPRRGMFWGLLIGGLILRLLLAASYPGLSWDMSCFNAWTLTAGEDLLHFYAEAGFSDYPPVYIYVLGLIGWIARVLGIGAGSGAFTVLVKTPAIIADLVVAVLLYRYARRQKGERWALLLMTLCVLNPAQWVNSALWGQVDSVPTLWLVLFLLSVERRDLDHAAAWLALAVLTKPQGLLLAPILLFAWIRERNARAILRSAAWGAVTFVLVILPFAVQHGPLWIFGLLKGTTDQYAYASFNGYNLFSLLGANLKADTDTLLFLPYKVWGTLFMAAAVVFSGYLYLRKDTSRRVWTAALVLVTGIFVLGFRMHERYLYPAVIFAGFWAAGRRDRRGAWLVLPFSVTVFANTFHVLLNDALYDGYLHIDPGNIVLRIGSLANCLLLAWLVYTGIAKEKEPALRPKRERQDHSPHMGEKPGNKDIGIVSLITGVYLIAALLNLGGFDAPRSCWKTEGGDSVEIIFNEEATLSAFSWYGRLGEGSFTVCAADETGQFHTIATFESSAYPDFGKWKHAELDQPVTTAHIRVTADAPGVEIAEMGWFDTNGRTVDILASLPMGLNDAPHPIADEQDRVAYYHSYLTGTYFDEIYHVRTAYEQMEHVEAYEYTHPPLGKIIISAGIALFGMTPFGWRLPGTVFGAAMIPLMYYFGYALFGRRRWAVVSALFMALDFMHFTQTRMATVDTYTAFFTLWMFYFMYRYLTRYDEGRSFGYGLWMLVLCGISVGLGAACKWSALYGGLGLAFLFFWDMACKSREPAPPALGGRYGRQAAVTILTAVGCFVLIPAAIYTLAYIPFFQVPGEGHTLMDMVRLQGRMYHYHADLVATHDFSSPWWSWPLIGRPLWLYQGEGTAQGVRSTLVTMGNPLIWWLTVPAVIAAGVFGWMRRDKRALFLVAAFVGQYLPWMLISRIAFIYHYFPILPFGMLSIVYVLKIASQEYPWVKKAVWWYLGACLALFIWFYPALSGLPVSEGWIRSLRWFPAFWYF